MENSEGSFAKNFYDDNYYESNIKNVDNKIEDNNITKKSKNDYILLTGNPKLRILNILNNIDLFMKNLKSQFLNEFKKISDDFKELKNYINNSYFSGEIKFNEKSENNSENKDEEEKDNEREISTRINKGFYLDKNNSFNFEIFEKNLNDLNKNNSKFIDNIYQSIHNIKNIQSLIEQKNNNDLIDSETILDEKFEIVDKNILIPRAISCFGLDNQFEIIKYDKENNLLIYIDNLNDLILKLINRKSNEVVRDLIIKQIFEDDIREIRYFSKKYNNDDNIENYLLVSSKKDEIKIFEIKFKYVYFQDILKEINHITNIYGNETKILNKELNDLSSCAIRFSEDLKDSQVIITCWEGKSIKIYNLFENKLIKDINSKTSCNVKYCNIYDDQYFIFCGCNSQDNYTCANCIDLKKLNDNNIEFIKYRDESEENENNVFFNFIIYSNNNIEYLIIVDEKGYIRIFNFKNDPRTLITKIFLPCESSLKIDISQPKERLNNIIIKNDYLLITQKNVGFFYLVNLEGKKLSIIKHFEMFDDKIISLRKIPNENDDYFLALGNNQLKDKVIISFKLELEK